MGYGSKFTPYVGAGYAGVQGFNHYLQSRNPRFGMQAQVARSSTAMYGRRRKTKSSNSFAARVRRLSSYKHNTIVDATNGGAMLHNNIYTTNITAKVTQGDTNADRSGDSIQLVALKLNGVIHSAAVSGAYTYRVLVGYSGEEYTSTFAATGLPSTEIFLPNGGTSFMAHAIVNPKAFTVLSDTCYDINSLVAAAADLISVNIKVNLSGKFPYQASASTFGKYKNLYVVVIGGVVGGTAGVTAAGSAFINTDLIFQDT